MPEQKSNDKDSDLMSLQPLYRVYREFALKPGGVSHQEALACIMVDSWSEATVHPKFAQEWRPHWFGRGQDDVTALLAAELSGGDIMGDRHGLFNRVPVGEGYAHISLCQRSNERTGHYVYRTTLLNNSRSKRLWDRYLILRQRAHFVMARAIR